MIRLSPAMTWSRQDHDIYVHGERQVLLLRDCPPAADPLMRLLAAGCDSAAIEAVDLDPARVADILDILEKAGCLTHAVSSRWLGTPVERQADYFAALGADPDTVQSTLSDATVLLLGVGGIGSIVLAHLVCAGVNHYTLVDGDVVQPSNLNRQMIYGLADVGRHKVDAATDWVKQRNPAATVCSVPRMLTDCSELLTVLNSQTSLVILAADAPTDIAVQTVRACLATGTPLMSGDCGLRTASWGPLLEAADLPAYLSALEQRRGCAPAPPAVAPMTASFGPTNAIAASYLARDIVHWFAGLPVPSLRTKVGINMDALTTNTLDF